MIKKLLQIVVALTFSVSLCAQEKDTIQFVKTGSPILYFELFGGISVIKDFGYTGGFELNYQYKKSLFSFRYSDVKSIKEDKEKRLLIIPYYFASENIKEYALLYGIRNVKQKTSFSISAGISHNYLTKTLKDNEGNFYLRSESYVGFPFEANMKWFSLKKRSKMIWNVLIPSGGVKLFGNISERSFIGLGGTFGIGLNKKY
ncbi:hypothetical protein [Flavobacterium pectinovorum]|uniref:hypothetical protein n=1 Tax=Flavobacterium pectinovorum TaxID=29533 RepID=UPI001FAC23D7|nr:hypothetical protein [Flavobacterium pectinovorum]MCI9843758.1 hypothetical protein [Flavobacterium pectinovorum]